MLSKRKRGCIFTISFSLSLIVFEQITFAYQKTIVFLFSQRPVCSLFQNEL